MKHNLYGGLWITFGAVCVVGLLGLALIGVNAWSDARHAQYLYDLEHPTPVPTPARQIDPTSAGDLAYAAAQQIGDALPIALFIFGIVMAASIVHEVAKVVAKGG